MATLKDILIIDEMHPSISDMLNGIGYQPDYQPNITRDQIIDLKKQYVGMIVRSKTPIDGKLLANQNKLEFIARAGAGVDNLDMDYLDSRKITMVNAPEGNRDALGEHVVGMLLSLANNLVQSNQQVRESIWDREGNRGFELGGKTVGIIGYGFMGSAVAEKLSSFGCNVIAYDKYKTGFSDQFVHECSMEEIFENADILSLHVPLTDETKGLVDLEYFNGFKKQVVFVNAARGEVVVSKDLLKAMDEGLVSHAALDVLENEKFGSLSEKQKSTYQGLFSKPNVLLSPHVGGWTFESYENINRVLVDKISKLDI